MKIRFADAGHKEFYLQMKKECPVWDCYHKALFYTLGISPDCRKHREDLYLFGNEVFLEGDAAGIRPETAFSQEWLTSGSVACIRLAYNLFNGYAAAETTPSDLFCCGYAPYFHEAIKLRYPEYHKGERWQIVDAAGRVLQENISERILADSYAKVYDREYGGNHKVELQPDILIDC